MLIVQFYPKCLFLFIINEKYKNIILFYTLINLKFNLYEWIKIRQIINNFSSIRSWQMILVVRMLQSSHLWATLQNQISQKKKIMKNNPHVFLYDATNKKQTLNNNFNFSTSQKLTKNSSNYQNRVPESNPLKIISAAGQGQKRN